LLTQLQAVYGQISAYSETRDTGLLNNLLRILGGVVPPLSDVLETVRAILIGDSVTILDQLAIAQALGEKVCHSDMGSSLTQPQASRFSLSHRQSQSMAMERLLPRRWAWAAKSLSASHA
jgi:hypothetical protein